MSWFNDPWLKNLLQKGREASEKIMNNQKFNSDKAKEILGYPGKILGSKSFYNHNNPYNIVIFNSNICTKNGKIWYGDIDITLQADKLKDLAKAIGQKIFVLYEMDGRFDAEERPKLDKAIYETDGDNQAIKETEYYEAAPDGTYRMKEEYKHDMSHLYGKPKTHKKNAVKKLKDKRKKSAVKSIKGRKAKNVKS